MGLMVTGLFLFPLISLIAASQHPTLRYILGIPSLAYICGFLFLICGEKKLGAKMIFISSFFFIPIGMLGVIGARNFLDKLDETEFLNKGGESGK